ncbi:hypothetical protein [Collinsella intestinalis]|uniref:Ppx/GppA phosphatase N-terminal domain-containing protein n=1 Tax=Collinsella intestinalis TaxID=147207 RepID=A0A414NF72_9ACTN|nr:hypothetical protein [Collinsella intestinalis]RHF38291.1 hypothetical protein DW682_00815 [Collinsella intestinalis]
MSTVKIAAIDLGTVSSRLLCAEMSNGQITASTKRTIITDLGERVDAAGVFAPAAIDRVVQACAEFVREAREFGAQHMCCTLTSAARDVSNGNELLDRLRDLGLVPQVIPGEVEARLTFYGVAHDFAGERIAVADSGGGSTELVVGRASDGGLELDCAESLNIGCRRVTERFFSSVPPSADELDKAAAWARAQFEPYWAGLANRPERLVAVGGTVTTLVAMVHELAVYDSHFVHLRDLTIEQVEDGIDRMRSLTVEQIAQLPGIQAKRAPVILAGAIVVRELMRAGGYGRLTVSENSLLAGAAATIYEAAVSGRTAIGRIPELSSW